MFIRYQERNTTFFPLPNGEGLLAYEPCNYVRRKISKWRRKENEITEIVIPPSDILKVNKLIFRRNVRAESFLEQMPTLTQASNVAYYQLVVGLANPSHQWTLPRCPVMVDGG